MVSQSCSLIRANASFLTELYLEGGLCLTERDWIINGVKCFKNQLGKPLSWISSTTASEQSLQTSSSWAADLSAVELCLLKKGPSATSDLGRLPCLEDGEKPFPPANGVHLPPDNWKLQCDLGMHENRVTKLLSSVEGLGAEWSEIPQGTGRASFGLWN